MSKTQEMNDFSYYKLGQKHINELSKKEAFKFLIIFFLIFLVVSSFLSGILSFIFSSFTSFILGMLGISSIGIVSSFQFIWVISFIYGIFWFLTKGMDKKSKLTFYLLSKKISN